MLQPAPLDYRDPEWVAKQLGIDKNAVYRYLDEGRLPGLRLGRKWLISESSLVEFLKREEREQTTRRRAAPLRHTPYARFIKKMTERAMRVLFDLAPEEALALGHNYVGPEHLLLAFAREPECVAARMLSNLGVDVRTALEPLISRGDAAVGDQVDLSPEARKAVELAIDEARRLRHHYIGTEHMLLGILEAGEGIACELLMSRGVSVETARTEMASILSEPRPSG